jgi:adenosyl cobinamide kinase/adenosyl cobinamide phosphate guanylyltransferase
VITLVLGGTRSGKSLVAERLVLAHPGPLTYVATGAATDPEMAARIERHRGRRDPRWVTVEAGADLGRALRAAPATPTLVDSLGTWVAGQPEFTSDAAVDPEGWAGRLDDLCAALGERATATVLVTDEVGMGVHPETEVGRRFRDVLGLVNQRVAAVSDEALLVVAGRVIRLEPPR